MTNRRPPGAPDGGEFSEHERGEAGISLEGGGDEPENPFGETPVAHMTGSIYAEVALSAAQIEERIVDGPAVAEGRVVRAELDALYEGLDPEQREFVDKTAKEYTAPPRQFLLAAATGRIDWSAVKDGWQMREILTDDRVAKYAAIMATLEAADPTKGEGRERLRSATRAVKHDDGQEPPKPESRIPRQP